MTFLTDLKSMTSFSAEGLSRLSAAEEMTKASQALQAAEGRWIKAQLKLEKAHATLTEVYDLSNAGFNVDLAPFSSPVEDTKAQLVKAKEEAHTAEKILSEAYAQISVAYENLQHGFSSASAPALGQSQPESSPAPISASAFAQHGNSIVPASTPTAARHGKSAAPATPSKAAAFELHSNVLLTPTKIQSADSLANTPATAAKAPHTPLSKNLSAGPLASYNLFYANSM
ncbi:hypothetical protein EV360DRAFT_90870 [Lentinula raphanica]|nr:hypothetical protein EV360DRAFT_90870 [Lentinula raphanica]